MWGFYFMSSVKKIIVVINYNIVAFATRLQQVLDVAL